MKQAWNELCSYQDDNPWSFKFSELKSYEIHLSSVDFYGSRDSSICSSSLHKILERFPSFPDDIKNSENVLQHLFHFNEVICWFCFY